jgi:hypothetical protein
MVLAEEATQRTTTEKNGSRAVFSADGWLLTQMGLNGPDPQLMALSAETQLSGRPVDAASAGTELTGPVARETRFLESVEEPHCIGLQVD